jgi:hypothetical protein
MQRLFATVFTVTCIIGSTPGFARSGAPGIARGTGIAHVGAGVGHRVGAGIGRGAGLRQVPGLQNRIPAALPPPPQAPIINGPLTPNGLPSMGGAGLP